MVVMATDLSGTFFSSYVFSPLCIWMERIKRSWNIKSLWSECGWSQSAPLMEIEEPSGILSEYMTERRVRKRLKVERTPDRIAAIDDWECSSQSY